MAGASTTDISLINPCGTCTLCCRLPAVPELSKPINNWCEFCKAGKGCLIYSKRPPSCCQYECMWISEGNLADDLRPDRCKIIFEQLPGSSTILAIVDPSYPDQWRKKKMVDLVQMFNGLGRAVVVTNGTDKHIFLPKDKTAQEVMADIQLAITMTGVTKWQSLPTQQI